MDLKDFGQTIAKLGLPLLGAALPIPGGAAIGTALANYIGSPSAKPEDILQTLTASADAVEKAKEFETTHQETLLKIQTDAEIRSVEAVNASIQAEAKADHWPTYGWRPFIGFQFGFYVMAQWVLPMLNQKPPTVDPQLMLVIGAILGVASYFRGKAQADPSIPTDNRG